MHPPSRSGAKIPVYRGFSRRSGAGGAAAQLRVGSHMKGADDFTDHDKHACNMHASVVVRRMQAHMAVSMEVHTIIDGPVPSWNQFCKLTHTHRSKTHSSCGEAYVPATPGTLAAANHPPPTCRRGSPQRRAACRGKERRGRRQGGGHRRAKCDAPRRIRERTQ